jgi:hypothetical protein
MSMKNSSDTIGNRSHDLPFRRAVPQPLRHRVPLAPGILQHFAISTSRNLMVIQVLCSYKILPRRGKKINAVSDKYIIRIIVPRGPYSSVTIVTVLRIGRPSLIPGRGSNHLRHGVETCFENSRCYKCVRGCVVC